MIEINLLSQEGKAARVGKISIESKYLAYILPLIFGILILAHISLLAVSTALYIQLSSLNGKWNKLSSQRELLNNLKNNYNALTSNARLTQELDKRRLNWSEKFNRLSLDLPSGIWFNEIQITPKDFTLKASCVSLKKEEMSLIKKFMDSLKSDAHFLRDLGTLELGYVQKRQIGTYDVVDFILTAKLKGK